MKRTVLLVVVAVMLITCLFSSCKPGDSSASIPAERNPNLAVWTTHSLDRVRKNRQPESTKDVELYAAKGEYQSFQVVTNSLAGNIELTDLTVTDFTGPEGTIESQQYVTVYREHYIAVEQNSPERGDAVKVEGTGMIPDALIPVVDPTTGKRLSGNRFDAFPYTLTPEECQPFWIDVEVPRSAKAGEYTATYAVHTDAGAQVGTVTLTVWDIELPKLQSQGIHFRSCQMKTEQRAIVAAQHKMFSPGYDLEIEELLHEKYGYNQTSVTFWSGADENTLKMSPAPAVDKIKEALSYRLKGLPAYAYTADEISGALELYEPLRQWGQAMHKAGVKHLVVMTPDEALFDDGLGKGQSVVDVWVVLPNQYNASKEVVEKAQAKGDEVWSYNCLVQDEYSPKWMLDYPLIGFRIQPGFINYSLNFDGFLYWLVDNWNAVEDPWTSLAESSLGALYNGEGNLFYPGDDVGLENSYAPSIRAKAIRDGLQDYELCKAIEAMGQEKIAREYANLIGPDFINWVRSGDTLIEKRIEMGNSVK